jgi:hypothetical protein
MGLFSILLPSDRSLEAFQLVSLSLLFTFPLVSMAFLDRDYRLKGYTLFALFAVIGAPPLVLGEQFYRMIKQLIDNDDLIAGGLLGLIGFGLTLAAIQIIGKVILIRTPVDRRRKADPGELFFAFLYLAGIISLTAFKGPLLSLLNDHPLLNLW